jgi:hypothetical protein
MKLENSLRYSKDAKMKIMSKYLSMRNRMKISSLNLVSRTAAMYFDVLNK